MVKLIELNEDYINRVDMEDLMKYVKWNKNSEYFTADAGKEHYKLLAYLSSVIDENFYVDIGTYFGFSAIALSANPKATVVTYDVCDWIPDEEPVTVKTKTNVKTKIMNCVHDMSEIVKSKLVVLDIDPHDGIEEVNIMAALRSNGYRGLVVLDDIHLNDDMNNFWKSIPEKKYDVSQFGHWSGTGIVVFDDTYIDVSV